MESAASLNELAECIMSQFKLNDESIVAYADFRDGDIRRSLASINKAHAALGFAPARTLSTSLKKTIAWNKWFNQ